MVSVTQAFGIDLTGQVCTESLDGRALRWRRHRAGVPPRRARLARRPRGRLPRLANPGAASAAVKPELGPGEAVSIPRADVHWVITEYGTAYLFGRSLSERAVVPRGDRSSGRPRDAARGGRRAGLVGRKQLLRSRDAYPFRRSATCACVTTGRYAYARPEPRTPVRCSSSSSGSRRTTCAAASSRS